MGEKKLNQFKHYIIRIQSVDILHILSRYDEKIQCILI